MNTTTKIRKALSAFILLAGYWAFWPFLNAATGYQLTPYRCDSDALLRDGAENSSTAEHYSGGGGGTLGNQLLTITLNGVDYDYNLYVPERSPNNRAYPVMLMLAGSSSPSQALFNSQVLLNRFVQGLEREGVIGIAPVAFGSSGGWVIPETYQLLDALISEIGSAQNIDLDRISGWGFSAGGHVMHGYMLPNSNRFAAYSVHAGNLTYAAGIDAPQAAARKIPVNLRVGATDTSISPASVALDRDRFLFAGWTLGTNVTYQTVNEGHTYNYLDLVSAWQSMCLNAVAP
jgi:poly(3-hydroxybutyrate) depolymerase